MVLALLLGGCACAPAPEGQFIVGGHAVKIEAFDRASIRAFLTEDWAKFNTHVKDTKDWFGKPRSVDWYPRVTPPIPSNWPPQQRRSVTFYAYGEYQELFNHGPSLSRSAPWAKVIVEEGLPARKVILASALGPVVHGEGSVPLGRETADRKIQIIRDGESRLSNFIAWKSIPADAAEVKAIREYYCQWALTDRTAELIKDNHRAFFAWLACPPTSAIPVLAAS